MKIQCECGCLIYDGGDDLPHKAHFIPDQKWNALFDAIDELIEKNCLTDRQRNAACTKIRILIGNAARCAWQCRACGRLYIDDSAYRLQSYAPTAAETTRELFRSAPADDRKQR
jgi:hypothetical protein